MTDKTPEEIEELMEEGELEADTETEEGRETLLDNDEINAAEEGYARGAEEAEYKEDDDEESDDEEKE